ncbi:HEPN domain-containing protein [Candidatus Parcubacteria bacterium]|nr:MAG: HEPN domain-containing protein [Candidatus Parcubacteria bacterium]
MDNQEEIILEWIKKAEEDEFAGEIILKDGNFFTPACFHFQQAAEKLLKSLLIFHDIEFSKTHDLLELETLLLEIEPDIKDCEEELILLNRYSVEVRYPGDYPEIFSKEANEALKAARKIKDFVLKKIKTGA